MLSSSLAAKKKKKRNGATNGHKVGLLFCFLIFLFNPGDAYSCLRASQRKTLGKNI